MPRPKRTLLNRATLTIKHLLPIEQYFLAQELTKLFGERKYKIDDADGNLTITLYTKYWRADSRLRKTESNEKWKGKKQ